MDANDIMNAINGILDIGDTLDNSGIGVKALTNGKNTTRELCQMELGAFLLYIGDGAPSFTDAQATLVNLLLAQQFGMTPAWKMKSVAAELDKPDPNHNVTYQAFSFADEAVARQQGKPAGTQLRDSIVNLYETFGGMMVAVNENPISRMRYNNYISGLKARLSGSTGFSAASSSVSAPVSSGSVPAADIEQYIPAGVTLTDNQRGYLAGVVGAMDMFGKRHVTTSQVAIFMKKDNSAVSSGVRTLVKKGILDINDDAEIVIAEKKPAGVSAGKAKTGAKTAATKKTSAGKTAKYNDQVSFELSREYEMAWDKDKDGNDVCKIVSVKRADGDSDNPETTVLVSVIENNDPNKDQFDKLQEGDDKSTFIPLDSDPEGLLCITYLDMQILSMNFRTSLYRLFMKLSPKETLLLFLTSTSSGGENKFFEDFTRLSEIWRFVRINGEACDLGSAGEAGTFAEYMKELADNEGKPKKKKTAAKKAGASGAKAAKKEKKIIRTKSAKFPDAEQYKDIHQVEDEAERVTPMGTWSVPVPPGCSYTMDPDCAGGGFSGKYPLQIQRTEDCDFDRAYDSAFSFAVFASGARLDAFSALTDLSTDEAADAMTEMAFKADAAYSFFKRTSALAIMTKEAPSEKNGYALIFLIFSRGMQLVDNGQIVVRGNAKKKAREEAEAFLNSISPMSRPDGDAGYKPVVISERFGLTYHDQKTLTIDDCITLPVPDGFKASTDQNLIVAPRKFSIVPKDYPDFSKAMEAAVGITAVPMQGDIPEYKPGICDKVCGIIVSQFEQQNIFVQNAPRIVAQQTTKGIIFYQKIFDNQTMQCSVAKAILWTGKHGYIMSFAINYGEKIADRTDVSNDSWQIMSDWMNRIQLPGDKLYYVPSESDSGQEADRIGDLVSPLPPEELHEHFDLITNGGYTTHRDADFIGQSIRGLMEKCGSAGEDAYDEMKIAGDAYDLDKSALKLAQVFRLDESLFEPYKDREALIRLSVFSDVRMLHALRSLSWMVSRYSEKENRPISKITFDELQKMGRIIEKKKYLNYDGSSGFVNLCNHYDWHVFYVPEKYRDGSTAMTTDLRYLTGKENRGGNTMSVFIPGISDISSMNRKNNIISRNEETLESLDALRKDLKDLLPVMETIHDGLLEDRDRSKALEGPLADALTAWCALAVAAKEPFYSEEAADTPEADAALEAPPERPKDKLDDKPVSETQKAVGKAAKKVPVKEKSGTESSASKKPGAVVNDKDIKSSSAPKTGSTPVAKQKTEPVNNNVRILNVGGARVIEGTDYMADTDPRPLVIPEGVVRIDDSVFSHCHMESATLPRTMRTLGHHVFSTCENLKKVELNEGLEEIDAFIVSDCPKMTEITLPDSIRKIDNDAFLAEFSVTNPVSHITVKLSGKLARYLVANNEYPDIPALRARDFVVDGERYKSLEEYVRRAPKQERNRNVSTGGNGATEEQKQHERNALINRITALEKERDSLGGLFAGLKRKKLQKEIDMLKEEIRRL